MDDRERDPVSITRANIERKRRALRRRRRRALVRLTGVLIVLAALLVVLLVAGFAAIRLGVQTYYNVQSRYQGYLERQQAWRGEVDPRFDGYTNVLILGLDDGADAAEDGGRRADTVLLLSSDNQTGKVRFLSIPRDTWIHYPGTQQGGRISSAYTVGGPSMMVRAVSNLLGGVSIHQYVVVDTKAFADLIDQLGGLDLYVEGDMDYDDPASGLTIHLKRGYQHLDGRQVQGYLRYRSPEMGDTGRVQRQQKFVRVLYNKLLQVETIPHLPEIAKILREEVDTSAEIFDAAHLANVLRGISTEQPETKMLPGEPAQDDDTIWVPDESAIRECVQELFPEEENGNDEDS